MNNVSKSIKRLRSNKKMTQDELAAILNVTRQAVSNWENEKTQPDIETITKIAEYFGVSTEEIIYGEVKSDKKFDLEINKDFAVDSGKTAVSFGTVLAIVISYSQLHSVGWAILHGLLGWLYVIYYVITNGFS
ncbi:MAG: helix-turn-helix transcriptional regulator [Clostridia bacterium]|nr:helix-turn-helix transcriptional regulator [Clostridia bacterium]